MISFAHYVSYMRKSQRISAHDLATQWGISTRTLRKLEAGETIRKSLVDTLLQLSDFYSLTAHQEDVESKKLSTFFRHVLYAKYQDATPMAMDFADKAAFYQSSPLIISYTLFMWMYVIHTQNPIIDVDKYYQQLQHLEAYMTPAEKELLAVEKTGYYFVKGELKRSFDHFHTIVSNIHDNHLKALNYFLVGASGVNEIQSMDRSIDYLSKAQSIFEEYGNYLRSNRCNVFLQIAYIHSRDYQGFFDLYAQKDVYLHADEEYLRMHAFIEGNLARYYVISKQYLKACEVLRPLDFPSNINYFLYLIAAYQSGLKKDLDRLLKIQDLDQQLLNAHHRLFLQALKTYQNTANGRRFLDDVKTAVNASEKANDYIAYIALNPVLIALLKKAKKYKEAHFYASKELDYLRQFH